MNIYIYGNSAFINEIYRVLEHGNMKFKIDDGEIEVIKSLEQLKHKIKSNPYDIYLIDEAKIIYNDFVSKYLKFLLPKDGIKSDFLDKHGVGDISIRDKDSLALYITKRLEAMPKKPDPKEITTLDEIFDVFETKEEKNNE